MTADLSRFTDRARISIQLAKQEAARFGHDRVRPCHLLLGLLKEGSGIGCFALQRLGVDLRMLRNAVNPDAPFTPSTCAPVWVRIMPGHGETAFNEQAAAMLERAVKEADRLDHRLVGTEHLLLALVNADPDTAVILQWCGVKSAKAVQDEVLNLIGRPVHRKPEDDDGVQDDTEEVEAGLYDDPFPDGGTGCESGKVDARTMEAIVAGFTQAQAADKEARLIATATSLLLSHNALTVEAMKVVGGVASSGAVDKAVEAAADFLTAQFKRAMPTLTTVLDGETGAEIGVAAMKPREDDLLASALATAERIKKEMLEQEKAQPEAFRSVYGGRASSTNPSLSNLPKEPPCPQCAGTKSLIFKGNSYPCPTCCPNREA